MVFSRLPLFLVVHDRLAGVDAVDPLTQPGPVLVQVFGDQVQCLHQRVRVSLGGGGACCGLSGTCCLGRGVAKGGDDAA